MDKGNIYLVGFMAVGKTSVGKALAKKKKWQFVDLDDLIELKERRTISEIFAKEGELYFRRIEKQTLKEVVRENKFIVACGGGAVIDPENIRMMKETGRLICLTASPDVILKRISGQSHRPLLNVENPRKQIDLLLKLRAPYYARADKLIDTSRISIEEVVCRILRITTAKNKITAAKQKRRGGWQRQRRGVSSRH